MDSPPAKQFCEDGHKFCPPSETLSEDNLTDDNMEQNPMLNPVVLKHFFGVCKLEDLRRFRLVCPLWRDVSLERWREEMIVHVAFDEYFELRKYTNKRQRLHWKEAHILYQTPSIAAKPFRKFRLCYWQFPAVKPKRDSLFKRELRDFLNKFWLNCGPWMTELHLKETKIESSGSFIQVVTEFMPNMVLLNLEKIFEIGLAEIEDLGSVKTQLRLKSLGIQFSARDETGERAVENPQFTSDTWFGLFATFPKLEELRWKCFYDVHCQNMLLAWSRIVDDDRHAGRKLNIKCYDINGAVGLVTQIGTLNSFFEHPDFAFSHIEVGVNNSDQEGIVSRALKKHQNTLRTLSLFSESWNLHIPFRGPRFLSTAELDVDATPNFHFLKNLLHLKKLSISGYTEYMAEETQSEAMEIVNLHKLSHLELYRNYNVTGISVYKPAVDIFVNCMPNLTVLRCPLSNGILRVVCQHWKGLRVIEDLSENDEGTLDDEGITGFVPGGEGSRFPNITLLKYLGEFEAPCILSDKSVYDGFLQLEHLMDLNVPRIGMSSEAVSALSTKFGSQIFHSYHRINLSYYNNVQEDDDKLVEDRLNMQMVAKDYGIILGEESEVYGNVHE